MPDLPHIPRLILRALPREKRAAVREVLDWYFSTVSKMQDIIHTDGAAFQSFCFDLAHRLVMPPPQPDAGSGIPDALRREDVPRASVAMLADGLQLFFVRQRHRDRTQQDAMLRQTGGALAEIIAAICAVPTKARGDVMALGKAVARAELLRRVPRGLARGRLYIPESEAERFEVNLQDLADGRATPRVQDLMWSEAKAAREALDEAAPAAAHFPDDGSRKAVQALLVYEREELDRLEKAGWKFDAPELKRGRIDALKFAAAHLR